MREMAIWFARGLALYAVAAWAGAAAFLVFVYFYTH
jgi:hypothetical protein